MAAIKGVHSRKPCLFSADTVDLCCAAASQIIRMFLSKYRTVADDSKVKENIRSRAILYKQLECTHPRVITDLHLVFCAIIIFMYCVKLPPIIDVALGECMF